MLALVLCNLASVAGKGKKKSKDGFPHGMHGDAEQRMKAHHEEMKYLNKIKSDDVDDWTIHEDVDKTFYWFSRTLKRSQREAPQGWVKDAKGKWKAPPRKRDEL